jgi:dTDP-4-dehydrorhamnose reductase
MRLLLLGGSGQVGTELRELSLPRDVELVAPTRSIVDLQDPAAISRIIATERWDAVINAAGFTSVDRAESEEASAYAVNGLAPGYLAAETARHGIPLIHISTDYVFDGRKGLPYVEADYASPLNTYGRSKLAGEHAIQAANPRHIILRTAWVFSPFRANFVRTILRLARERERLTIVADQRGCPTSARDIAETCIDLAVRCATEPETIRYGVYHLAGGGEATWLEFAKAIIDMTVSQYSKVPQVEPIRTIDYPTPAIRPADSRLNCTAIAQEFGIALRPWRSSLIETIHRLSNRP